MGTLNEQGPNSPLDLNESELLQWDAAWQRVENYLSALGIRNKIILSNRVGEIMDLTEFEWRKDRNIAPALIAGRKIDEMVTHWLRDILELSDTDSQEISRRGRLSILLIDVTNRWQNEFLSPAPWPKDLVDSLKERYVSAGPEFNRSHMQARPLDLGALPNFADRALQGLDRAPRLRSILMWSFVVLTGVSLFFLTR